MADQNQSHTDPDESISDTRSPSFEDVDFVYAHDVGGSRVRGDRDMAVVEQAEVVHDYQYNAKDIDADKNGNQLAPPAADIAGNVILLVMPRAKFNAILNSLRTAATATSDLSVELLFAASRWNPDLDRFLCHHADITSAQVHHGPDIDQSDGASDEDMGKNDGEDKASGVSDEPNGKDGGEAKTERVSIEGGDNGDVEETDDDEDDHDSDDEDEDEDDDDNDDYPPVSRKSAAKTTKGSAARANGKAEGKGKGKRGKKILSKQALRDRKKAGGRKLHCTHCTSKMGTARDSMRHYREKHNNATWDAEWKE